MIRATVSIFCQALLLLSLAILSSAVLGDAGHDAKRESAGTNAIDHSNMKMNGHGAHWTAPPEAAKRSNPVKTDAASLARGKKLFEANCVVCHGQGGRGDGPGAKDLDPRPADLVRMRPGHSDGDFAWKIAEGRTPMPPFKSSLNEAQIWDVVNYVKRGLPGNKK